MAFALSFYAAPAMLLATNALLAETLTQTDPEALRMPSKEMEPVAQALQELLGEPVEPRVLTQVSVEEEHLGQVLKLADSLAQEHQLVVLLGDSGVLFNYSVWSDPGVAQSYALNSLGSMWSQVNASSLHAAFADALRGPDPEVMVCCTAPVEVETFGRRSRFIPLPDGDVKVVREGADWACETTVDSVARAVELLLLFADRCPALLDLDWTPAEMPEDRGISPSERLTLPLRALDAVEKLAPGQMVTLCDNPRQPLTYGRNAKGQWEAIWVGDFNLRYARVFDSFESLLEVAHTYTAGELPALARTWDPADDVWNSALWSVTAAELPDRDDTWRDASVRAFHEQMRFQDAEPSVMIQSFVEAANARIGNELLIAEQQLEAAPVVTIMVAAETASAAFERLIHLAEDRNISLVVNGDLVLYNPSGAAEPGRDLCTLSLWNGPLLVGRWECTNRASLMDAAHRYQPWCRIESTSPRSTPVAQRFTASAEYEDGGFKVMLISSTVGHHSRGVSISEAFLTLYCMTFGADYLQQHCAWDNSLEFKDHPKNARFFLGTSWHGLIQYSDGLLIALEGSGLPKVGDWVAINDTQIVGDYCQVDRIAHGEYLVEWGHDLGEIECYQLKTKDFAYALLLLRGFVSDDRQEFEALPWKLVRS